MATVPIFQSARLWHTWNEMVFYAGVTIALRSLRLASELATRGVLPAGECLRMVGEKQLAVVEAMTGAWLVSPKGDGVRIVAAVLKPYRRRTRANARRLSRRAKH